MPPRYRIIFAWASCALCLLLVSCNDLKKAHGLLNDARTSAVAARTNVDKAVTLLAEPEPRVEEAVGHLSQAHSDLNTTIDALDGVNQTLGGLKNDTSFMDSVVTIAIVVGILAALGVLIYFAPAIRPWLTAIGLLAPRRSVARQADIDAAALSSDSPETIREAVAARRARDAEYDKAMTAAMDRQRSEHAGK